MQGTHCCCEDCTLTLEELPVPTITGMHTAPQFVGDLGEDWIVDGCCATIIFKYDVTQPLVIYDGGDVMSYDKTESYSRELFYFPVTCPTVTQLFWESVPDTLFWIISPPVEPIYENCCREPVAVNRLTTTIRSRGGQRFIVTLRPISISIVITKTIDYTCNDETVTRYVVRSTRHYEGKYYYVNYNELDTSYSLSDNGPCWKTFADTTVGSYPFDINYFDPDLYTGTGVSWDVCREKVLIELPIETTNYTFLVENIPNPDCTFTACIDCPPELDCFSSGETGDETPQFGFCDENILVVNRERLDFPLNTGFLGNAQGIHNLVGHDCVRHQFYYWSAFTGPGIGICDGFVFSPDVGVLGPINHNGSSLCCGPQFSFFTDTQPVIDWANQTNPSQYKQIPQCDYIHRYYSYTTIHAGAGSIITLGAKPCPTYKPNASSSCFPTWTCNACSTGSSPLEWEMNTVTPPSYQTYQHPLYCRTTDATRSVICSGYMEKEVCPLFEQWTITFTPRTT